MQCRARRSHPNAREESAPGKHAHRELLRLGWLDGCRHSCAPVRATVGFRCAAFRLRFAIDSARMECRIFRVRWEGQLACRAHVVARAAKHTWATSISAILARSRPDTLALPLSNCPRAPPLSARMLGRDSDPSRPAVDGRNAPADGCRRIGAWAPDRDCCCNSVWSCAF